MKEIERHAKPRGSSERGAHPDEADTATAAHRHRPGPAESGPLAEGNADADAVMSTGRSARQTHSLPIVPGVDEIRGRQSTGGRAENRAAGAIGTQRHRDIRDADLPETMRAFYDALGEDPLLRPFFAPIDMDAHLPRIVAFWSTILFKTRSYSGNAFAPHQRMSGLDAAHFSRWLATLEAILDARFLGPDTERMKGNAHNIAYSMQLRLGISPTGSEEAG